MPGVAGLVEALLGNMIPAFGARLLNGELAKKIVLFDGSQGIVHVSTADQAEFEGIDAELCLLFETAH